MHYVILCITPIVLQFYKNKQTMIKVFHCTRLGVGIEVEESDLCREIRSLKQQNNFFFVLPVS